MVMEGGGSEYFKRVPFVLPPAWLKPASDAKVQ